MSCATCHDPDHAYGPPNDLAVQLGGADGRAEGRAPSRRCATRSTRRPTPTCWTTRTASARRGPAAASPGTGAPTRWPSRPACRCSRPPRWRTPAPRGGPQDRGGAVRGPRFAPRSRASAGPTPPAPSRRRWPRWKRSSARSGSFHPYTSKFDLRAGNKIGGDFTAAEMRGYSVFVDPKRGNCASCHYHGAGLSGSSGMFTDYSYEAIGVPRNRTLAANQDPRSTSISGCAGRRAPTTPRAAGPTRSAGCSRRPPCATSATRKVFFHNGVIHSLEQAVRFYATRDTRPELWYPTVGGHAKAGRTARSHVRPGHHPVAGGAVQKYDDLPPPHRANIDGQMPLDGRARGAKPPLGERDVQDLICFPEHAHRRVPPPAHRRAKSTAWIEMTTKTDIKTTPDKHLSNTSPNALPWPARWPSRRLPGQQRGSSR